MRYFKLLFRTRHEFPTLFQPREKRTNLNNHIVQPIIFPSRRKKERKKEKKIKIVFKKKKKNCKSTIHTISYISTDDWSGQNFSFFSFFFFFFFLIYLRIKRNGPLEGCFRHWNVHTVTWFTSRGLNRQLISILTRV